MVAFSKAAARHPSATAQSAENASYSATLLTSASGQTRSFDHVGSMSGLPESGYGWAIYDCTP
jgi:hypothetical protein